MADLDRDAGVEIVLEAVVLEQHLLGIDVGPEAVAGIVVDVVPRDDPLGDHRPFRAAAFPAAIGAVPGVEGDLVVLHRAAAAARAHAQLAIVVDVVAEDLGAETRGDDADAVVPAHLVVVEQPARPLAVIAERALLVGAGVVLDDQVLDLDVLRLAAEGEGGGS